MAQPPYQDEFPQADDLTYLNHAAVAPWPRRAARAATAFAAENTRQGALDYPRWIEVEERLRERLAGLIGARSGRDVALLKNTSEGLSVVAHGLAWRAGENVVSCAGEFPSNRIVWESLTDQGVALRQVDVHAAEDPEAALMAACDRDTRLVAVSSVQYATGLRLDLARLGAFCREQGHLFCVDAIQSVGALRMDVEAIGADFLAADGHKWMLGPEGLAVFWVRPELRERLRLHQYGWHMVEDPLDFDRRDWEPAHSARRFEAGSPNLLCAHALSASLSLLSEVGMETVQARVLDNARYLMQRIAANPRLELVTPSGPGRHGGIVTFRVPGVDPDPLYRRLMAQRVVCARRGGGIRFSPHFYSPRAVLDRALDSVDRLLD